MNPDDARAFINGVLEMATDAGHTLRLEEAPDGYTWEWSNEWKGHSSARTKQVALWHACCDYTDMHRISKQFEQAVS